LTIKDIDYNNGTISAYFDTNLPDIDPATVVPPTPPQSGVSK